MGGLTIILQQQQQEKKRRQQYCYIRLVLVLLLLWFSYNTLASVLWRGGGKTAILNSNQPTDPSLQQIEISNLVGSMALPTE